MSLLSVNNSTNRIILVEDNEDDCLKVEDMILSGPDGYTVDAFDVGDQAVDMFIEQGACCIILDYRLEPEDGMTLLSRIKGHDPYAPVIMLTGQGSEELASTSIKAGASDYLVKNSLNETALTAAIRNAITQTQLEREIASQAAEQRGFLEVLVHDIKAPLQNIQDLSSIAIEEADAENYDELRKYLTLQHSVAARAHQLVTVLENYALLDGDVEFTTVSLSEVAQAAVDNLRKLIVDSKAEITIKELPTVCGHMPQLIQLVQNFIQNAIKYNKSQTPKITIQSVDSDERNVTVTISDNGIGMPQHNLNEIFKPFKRLWAGSHYEGRGLGLATCYKIVKRHGGDVWCTSSEESGSQFHVTFPKH